MALRPIDNALPTISERPKKQAKPSFLIQKQPDCAMSDENKALLPSSVDAAIDYIASENLEPIPDPESLIKSLIEDLDSKDWIKLCESLNNTRRFALHHSSLLLSILDKVILVLVKAMKNPRSALCKTSIMACSDIFNALGDKLINSSTSDAFDNLMLQLLLKASQDKRFVCEEADKALSSMVGSMTSLSLLNKLRPYVSHSNLRVRAKAAISVSNCVSKMGIEERKDFGFADLVQMAANSLNDRLPEARDAARSIMNSIYEAITKEEEEKQEAWQSFCESNLPPTHALSVMKIINSR